MNINDEETLPVLERLQNEKQMSVADLEEKLLIIEDIFRTGDGCRSMSSDELKKLTFVHMGLSDRLRREKAARVLQYMKESEEEPLHLLQSYVQRYVFKLYRDLSGFAEFGTLADILKRSTDEDAGKEYTLKHLFLPTTYGQDDTLQKLWSLPAHVQPLVSSFVSLSDIMYSISSDSRIFSIIGDAVAQGLLEEKEPVAADSLSERRLPTEIENRLYTQSPAFMIFHSYTLKMPGILETIGLVGILKQTLLSGAKDDKCMLDDEKFMDRLEMTYILCTKISCAVFEMVSGKMPDRDILAGSGLDADLFHHFSGLNNGHASIQVQSPETPAFDSFYMAAFICRYVHEAQIQKPTPDNLPKVSLRFSENNLQADISYAGAGRCLIGPGLSEDPVVQHLQRFCGKRLHIGEPYVAHNVLQQHATYGPDNQK